MGSPTELLGLTLSDLERPSSRSLRFQRITPCKSAELDYALL